MEKWNKKQLYYLLKTKGKTKQITNRDRLVLQFIKETSSNLQSDIKLIAKDKDYLREIGQTTVFAFWNFTRAMGGLGNTLKESVKT